jgi:hypothetical protein
MSDRTYRSLSLAILGFVLLLALPGLAAAGERGGSVAVLAGGIPAQTAALRSDLVPSWARPSATKAACHGNVSCQPNYPSCASWSGYSDCGDPICGIYRWCGNCGDPFGCWDDATRQQRERFRVCFDQLGNSCTEWQTTLVLTACGC